MANVAPPPIAPPPLNSTPPEEQLQPEVPREALRPEALAAESFEAALARVVPPPRHAPLRGLFERLFGIANGKPTPLSLDRHVAFDGFRSPLYDEKLERDRRYGTVYTVKEQLNAYVVMLELPRRLPISGLGENWDQRGEMPDYKCDLSLRANVLTIKGSVRTEVLRRLSYVSNSFPADFMTRIEFAMPVGKVVYRLRKKNLEVIIFKA